MASSSGEAEALGDLPQLRLPLRPPALWRQHRQREERVLLGPRCDHAQAVQGEAPGALVPPDNVLKLVHQAPRCAGLGAGGEERGVLPGAGRGDGRREQGLGRLLRGAQRALICA